MRRLRVSQTGVHGHRRPPRPRASHRVATETFASLNPATGEEVARFPVHDAHAVAEAVDRARIAARWWADLGFGGRKRRLLAWKSLLAQRIDELAELIHRETGKPVDDATLEIIAGDRPHRLGRQARRAGAAPAVGAPVADVGQPAGLPGLPALRRDRRDRPVELPGLHPDGVLGLRLGRRQRGRLQAERADPRGGGGHGRLVRRGGARAARAAAGDRPRRHRRRPGAAPASTRSRSPARGAPAARSWPPAPSGSPRCSWSAAARTPSSSAPTPTCRRPPTRSSSGRCPTAARPAWASSGSTSPARWPTS